MFVQRSPRPQIIPAEIGGQAKDIGVPLSLGGAGFQHRVIDADVLTFGILPPKCICELTSSKGRRNLLEHNCGLGQMLAQGVRQGTRAPKKYAAVPEIVSGSDE